MKKAFYLTTPLYYVNSKPHIGHSYTNIAADALSRYLRLRGEEVFFLTGTDEHGQKVDKAAAAAGQAPKQYTDDIVETFKKLWDVLGISYDDFIRTTQTRHIEAVQHVWRQLHEKNQLYSAKYAGFYCTPCETFFSDRQVLRQDAANLCPDCKRPVEHIEEENYFLKISQYQQWLIQTIQSDELQILPTTRKNEVLGFLENNTLQDLCISRPKSRLSWGIESPISPNHVTYVWFDALINYITAAGYPNQAQMFEKLWPANVHIVGKDILRHHAVYWVLILKALGISTPKMIFAHGWWVQDGQKMSKSLGNATDPIAICDRYGVDPYRYFLLREVPFGFDGTFSEEALIDRFNHDLANDIGNLTHRTLTMCEKYFDGNLPAGYALDIRNELRDACLQIGDQLDEPMRRLAFSEALTKLWALINQTNKFIEQSAPWQLFKKEDKSELNQAMVCVCESLRICAYALWPFMPGTAQSILKQMGDTSEASTWRLGAHLWGYSQQGVTLSKTGPLFPRIDKTAV